MLTDFIGKKNTIKAPIDGKIIALEEIPDQAFSNKLLGDGLAINPTSSCLVSPCSGYINLVAPTKHAIGITTADGLKILIHIGVDTVNLRGEGFELLVKPGDIVTTGSPLVNIDFSIVREKNINLTTAIIICNSNRFSIRKFTSRLQVEGGVNVLFEYQEI